MKSLDRNYDNGRCECIHCASLPTRFTSLCPKPRGSIQREDEEAPLQRDEVWLHSRAPRGACSLRELLSARGCAAVRPEIISQSILQRELLSSIVNSWLRHITRYISGLQPLCSDITANTFKQIYEPFVSEISADSHVVILFCMKLYSHPSIPVSSLLLFH